MCSESRHHRKFNGTPIRACGALPALGARLPHVANSRLRTNVLDFSDVASKVFLHIASKVQVPKRVIMADKSGQR
jgi:hypothetical protein